MTTVHFIRDCGAAAVLGTLIAVPAIAADFGVPVTPLPAHDRIDSGTVIDGLGEPSALADFNPGDFILVSGHVDAAGEILATRLEASSPELLSIEGSVAEVDAAFSMLRINAQWVDYSAAMLSGFPGGVPAEGESVEVTASGLTPGG